MARLVEIVSGVYEVAGLSFGRVYLVEGGDGLTLIDTNNPGRGEQIVGALVEAGRRIEDVRHIVVTHWHRDHTGSLARLVERSGARVYAGAADAPYVRGDVEPPPFRRVGIFGRIAPLLESRAPYERSPLHQELHDGDEIDIAGGMRVVETPGHTPGHISLLLRDRRLAFIGDAYWNVPGVRLGIGAYTDDPGRAKASVRKLATLDFDVACFGHGPPITRGASDAIRRFAERLR